MLKKLLLFSAILIGFTAKAQWTTSGNINNTNVGSVSIVRNTGYTDWQMLVIDPKGSGSMTIGNPNVSSGGYTALNIGISAQYFGYAHLQSVKSAGSSFGVLSLNPSGGNVGIGTADPGAFKLAVEGKIGAREIQVTNTTPWPDYVFEENYKLMSLDELIKYISINKHLPGIPSANEVKSAQGVNLGEMTTKLLEKIEELTLYIVKIKEENDDIKAKIELLLNHDKN